MKRIGLALVMIIGMVMLSNVNNEIVGQDKKDTKKVDAKDPKKTDTKEAKKDSVGGIEIYKGKNGFRYRIVDGEGKTIVMPIANKAWDTREEVIKALDALKVTLEKAKPVDVKE